MVTEGLMQIITYFTDNLLIGIVNVALIMGINMILCGYMVKESELNFVAEGYYNINFSAYSFRNYMNNAFDGLFVEGDPTSVPAFPPQSG